MAIAGGGNTSDGEANSSSVGDLTTSGGTGFTRYSTSMASHASLA